MHGFTLEVTGKRTLAVWPVLQGTVAIGTESTRKHRDVSADTLKGLVKNVGHLVLQGRFSTNLIGKGCEQTSKFCEAASGLVKRSEQ